MQYFKKPDGSVWAFEDDVTVESGFITADMVAMTAAEIAAHVNPPLTQAQIIERYTGAGQAHLDATAQSWGYDSLVSAASYAASGVAQYAAEAKALIGWRDAFWQASNALLNGVKAGTETAPASSDAYIALMPAAPARPA